MNILLNVLLSFMLLLHNSHLTSMDQPEHEQVVLHETYKMVKVGPESSERKCKEKIEQLQQTTTKLSFFDYIKSGIQSLNSKLTLLANNITRFKQFKM